MAAPHDRLWTVDDLAARWASDRREVKDAVRRRGLPYVQLGAASKHVSWVKVRFRPEAVLAWELAQQGGHDVPPEEPEGLLPGLRGFSMMRPR